MNQRILRSSQLDALELDAELDFLFREYISDMFSFFKTPLKSKFEPEINLILDLIVYGSVLTTGKSYGLYLQNLIYKHKVDGGFRPITIKQKVGFLLCRIITKWGWSRLGKYMTSKQWSELNQTSWKQAFTEFFVSVIPLLNFSSIKKKLVGRLFKEKVDLPENQCMICHQNKKSNPIVIMPYKTNCSHLYCYYCVKSNMVADPSFACPRCNVTITDIEPYVQE
ncbi:peroxisome assembly protein (Peroxin-2) [Boothiomyces sp. JEL0838]|nr:peroxisome assembly protein (Peroxin-2) [Boothiomyces sp. JEL0838]